MNDFRKALMDAVILGMDNPHFIRHGEGFNRIIENIVSIHGQFFSCCELQGMLEDAAQQGRFISNQIFDDPEKEIADEILSRHLGELESADVANKAHRDLYGSMNAEIGGRHDTPVVGASEIEQVIDEELPSWVQWIAKDSDHSVYLFEKSPEFDKGVWDVTCGRLKSIGCRVYFLKPMTSYKVCRGGA